MPGRAAAVTAASPQGGLPPAARLRPGLKPASQTRAKATAAARMPLRVDETALLRHPQAMQVPASPEATNPRGKPRGNPAEADPPNGEMPPDSQNRHDREAVVCPEVQGSKARIEASVPPIPVPRPPRMSGRP